MSGIRSVVANRLASNGQAWCELFTDFNSGTYNNQWMIVDYNKFAPSKQLAAGAGVLHVLEQIPSVQLQCA